MDLGLEGKNALVTGAEKGIGRAIAISLAEEGANVAYCDIKIREGEGSTENELRKIGRKVLALKVDVSRKEQVSSMVRSVVNELGSIDILVSNAGIVEWEPITKITLECWNRLIAVNLTGAMLCTHWESGRAL